MNDDQNMNQFVRQGFETGAKACDFKRLRGNLWIKEQADLVFVLWLQRSMHGLGWYLNMAIFNKNLEPNKKFQSWRDIHIDARAHEFMQHDIEKYNLMTSEDPGCSGECVADYIKGVVINYMYPEMQTMDSLSKFCAYATRRARDTKWGTYKRVMDLAKRWCPDE